jgi:hypothetical protein
MRKVKAFNNALLCLFLIAALLTGCSKKSVPDAKIEMCEKFEFSLNPEKWNDARRILHDLAIEERRDFQDISHVARKEEVGSSLGVTLSSGSSVKFSLSSTGHWSYSPEKVTFYMSEIKHPTRIICTSEKEVFEKAKSKLLILAAQK